MPSSLFGQQLLLESLKLLVQQHERERALAAKTTGASALLGQKSLVAPFTFPGKPYEYKVTALRECPTPDSLHLCDTPDRAAEYWRMHVPANPYFNPECECFTVLLLNTRRRVKGHHVVSIGTLDTILVHPREVFRLALIVAAAAVVLCHNHPSGDPTPSEADIKVTRDLIRAGQLLKIDVLDHVILGNPKHCSLRELGYFYT
ncbi:MAG: JAB domain-containing protein [Verrucomicrobiota bacterium]